MNWACRALQEREVIESGFEAHHTKVPLHVQCYGDTGLLGVVSRASFDVPRSHFAAVSELLMRTNKTLNIGNFELDWDTGTVLFRVTNLFPPGRAEERTIASLVEMSVAEMDRLTPQLAEVCRTPKGELLLLNIPGIIAKAELPAQG
jgi:hypothetical protein